MASISSTKVFDMTKPKMKPMQITMALAVARTLTKRNERDNEERPTWGEQLCSVFTFTFPRHFNYVVIERILYFRSRKRWKVFVQNKTVSKSKIIIMNGGSGLTRTFIDCLVSMQYRAKWLLVKEHQALRALPHFFLT